MLKKRFPDFVPDRMDSHEQQAWLYIDLGPTLLAMASNLLRDKEEAREVVQEVFAYLVAKKRTFDDYEQAKAILLVAVRNECFDNIKRRMRQEDRYRRHLENTRPDLIAYMESLAEKEVHLSIIQKLAKVNECIAQLPDPLKEVSVLKWIEGKSYSAICTEMKIKTSTARNYVSKAKTALLTMLRDAGVLSLAFTNVYYLFEIIPLTNY
jgi:RNA polymerase sigma-70 factor, ECF subfamily